MQGLRFIVTMGLLCYTTLAHAQQPNPGLSKSDFQEFRKEISLSDSVLSKRTDSLYKDIGELTVLFDSLTNSLEELDERVSNGRLDKSLENAELTLKKQNYLVDGFTYVIAGFTLIVAILAIIFALISRRVVNEATRAAERLNERMDYFDERVNRRVDSRFQNYRIEIENSEMDELFNDLDCNLQLQRKSAYEKITRIPSRVIVKYLQKIFTLLVSNSLNREEKAILVEVLIQTDNDEGN